MIRKLHSAWIWRLLHAVLPIEQRLNPLLCRIYGRAGLLRVPWGKYWLTMSAAWLAMGSSASAPLYRNPRRQNPEFFAILAPRLRSLKPGAIVDVGANIGIYILDFRQCTGAAIMVFEPDPDMFRLFAETLAFNAITDVSAFNLACGDRNGRLDFNRGINGTVASGHEEAVTIAVPVVRLDDRLAGAGPISLIKTDCEGYEWNVLSGCREIIRAHRPVLFVELHPKLIGNYAHSLQDVCDLLREFYDLSFWDFQPLQRSSHRALRFLSRYRAGVRPIASEADMLSTANGKLRPDQLFLLALPK
jgi:FkbM family methyltransferase